MSVQAPTTRTPAPAPARPTGDLLLTGVNPELRARGEPLLTGVDPELRAASWKKFQGAPAAEPAQYTPGPSLSDVKAGKAELASGHSGPAVVEVQAALRRSGEKLAVDGLYGPKTEEAVRSFQRKHELPETGVVDQGTAEALARVAPAPKPAPGPAPAPRPNNGGGGGGGGGGKVTPPPAPVPPAPVVPPSPYQVMAKTYDMGTKKLENYHKGQNPAFDAVVTQMLEQTIPIAHGDPDYDALMLARSRFSDAAHKAGF